MRYTEDYRRLIGLSSQGRLISGVEGQRTRDAHGAVMMSEDLLDGVALGFGGFDEIGAIYEAEYYDPSTPWMWRPLTNPWEAASDAEAVQKFDQYISTIPAGMNMALKMKVGENQYREVKRTVGTKGSTSATNTYQIYKNGQLVGTEDFLRDELAIQWFKDVVGGTPSGTTVELRRGGTVIQSVAVQRQTSTYDFYRDGQKYSTLVLEGDDQAVATAIGYQPTVPTTCVIEVRKNGVPIWTQHGTKTVTVKTQYWVSKRRVDESGRLVQEELSTISTSSLDAAKAHAEKFRDKAYTGEEIVLRTKDADVYKWAGNATKPTPDLGPTNEPPATTDFTGTGEGTGFQKFMAFMTAKAVPPVPNGAWVGIGVAIIVGVGIYAGTKKR